MALSEWGRAAAKKRATIPLAQAPGTHMIDARDDPYSRMGEGCKPYSLKTPPAPRAVWRW